MSAAISGAGGHGTTFAVALVLRYGFALTEEEAWPVLLEYNRRCRPPWSEKELRHKLKDAAKEGRQPLPRGYLLGATFPHHEQAPKHHYGASKFVRVDTHEPLRGGSVDPNLHDTIPSAPPNEDQRDRESVLIGRDSAGPVIDPAPSVVNRGTTQEPTNHPLNRPSAAQPLGASAGRGDSETTQPPQRRV